MATVSQYEKFKTADIIGEALSDWDVDVFLVFLVMV